MGVALFHPMPPCAALHGVKVKSPRSQRRTAPMLWKLRQATPRARQSLRIASI